MLVNLNGNTKQTALLRGATASAPTAGDPPGRVIRLKSADVEDVYDILSIGSQVIIRR